MSHISSVREVFDNWAADDGAEAMSSEHWPRVSQVLQTVETSGGKFLEIGPGNGYVLKHMAETWFRNGQCYGIDLSAEMLKCARLKAPENVVLQTGDFLAWTPPDGVRFDLIFSMEVFYYFEDIAANLRKAADLLKPGGQLIVMVDYFAEATDALHWPEELGLSLSLWSQDNYRNGFCGAGFSHVTQTRIEGGALRQGQTLCTRGTLAP